ncbi:group 1 truncated hemoglobin [uncultured Sphingomonas sp.]|uniref:group I truncated hemoglobin n=1 Tax=uncultured Sphingomonas sp. TaxID=158754 RepID=UPI0035CA8B84
MILLAFLLQVAAVEEPVAPYVQSPANAGAAPFADDGMWRAFHGRAGVERMVDAFLARNLADPRIDDIFKGQDRVRLRRVLNEHFCYLLGGGCAYTGRSMKDAHRNMGLQSADMGALTENLQWAMRAEGVPFVAQNRLLAKLAPMKRDVVKR